MSNPHYELNQLVLRKGTRETGVVIEVLDDLLKVIFPSGSTLVSVDDVEPAAPETVSALAAGKLGELAGFKLRLRALFLRHAYRYDEMSGLSSARIEPALHQIYIAHRVTQKLQPRMILADEVGLGKTIEAGLIIKELKARSLLNRILIVCPASLQIQWQQELQSKFNEAFEIMDGAAVQYFGKNNANPWLQRDEVITSLNLVSNQKHIDRVLEADWDLVIFDEAHKVRRWRQSPTNVKVTNAYRLADDLKEIVSGLLLLTATPMQLHPFELFSLVELVEPGLFNGYEAFEAKGKQLPRLNDLMLALRAWPTLSTDDRAAVLLRHKKLISALGKATRPEALDDKEFREGLMDVVSNEHPLAGVMVRNRKSEVLKTAIKRNAKRVMVDLSPEEEANYADISSYIRDVYNASQVRKKMVTGFLMVSYQKMLTSSSHAIRKSLQGRLAGLRKNSEDVKLSQAELADRREAAELDLAIADLQGMEGDPAALAWEIEVLEGLIERLGRTRDSKAVYLVDAIIDPIFQERPDEKVLIFTQFIETQLYLEFVLKRRGLNVAIFNGRLNLDEKEEAVRRFKGDVQVLISTESGGEGRNFQFCHLMVNYDLPWNPMKVEQRIGRLDRIGQKRQVFIYNLACRNTLEERVLSVLETRIGLFEESVGALDPILGEVESEIERIAMDDVARFDEQFTTYEATLDERVREAREKEVAWADFALDRASFRRDDAEVLLSRAPLARWTDLKDFAADALSYLGGFLSDHSEGGDSVSLSPKLGATLGMKISAVRGTFDPSVARDREDLSFFAVGHPLVDGLLDLVGVPEAPTTTVFQSSVVKAPQLQIFYEVASDGIRGKGKLLVHKVGENLEVRSEVLDALPALGTPVYDRRPLPEWVVEALRQSGIVFEKEFRMEREESQTIEQEQNAQELQRAARIFDYRRLRLERIIEEQGAWIERVEAAGSGRERKILPARKGKLRKDSKRLESLEDEHSVLVQAIRNKKSTTRGGAIAAALAVPE